MTPAARRELRADLAARVPRWYRPWLHLALPGAAGAALAAWALSRVHGLTPLELLALPAFVAAQNAVEWHVHRGLLHRRTWPFDRLYLLHAPQHHAVFVPGEMAIGGWRELRLVLLPAWGILALLAAASPVALLLLHLGTPNLAALWTASAVAYVLAYQGLHLACHLPAAGRLGRLALARRLRRRHEAHHAPALMQRWNFNVTLPLWDLLRGTLWRPADERPRTSPSRTTV